MQRDDPLQGRVGFQFEVAVFVAEGQAGRQVAIGAGEADASAHRYRETEDAATDRTGR